MGDHRTSWIRRRRLVRFALLISALSLLWTSGALTALRSTWLANSTDRERTIPQADVAIVLGAMAWGEEPSPALAERLDPAADLYNSGRVRRIIVTGGLDTGGVITEAEAAARYLERRHGIPRAAVSLEETSTSTAENLLNAQAIMAHRGLRTAVVVTHGYHLHRALLQAQDAGLDVVAGLGAESRVLFLPPLVLREVPALAVYLVRDRWLLRGASPVAVALADLALGAVLVMLLIKAADHLPLPGAATPRI